MSYQNEVPKLARGQVLNYLKLFFFIAGEAPRLGILARGADPRLFRDIRVASSADDGDDAQRRIRLAARIGNRRSELAQDQIFLLPDEISQAKVSFELTEAPTRAGPHSRIRSDNGKCLNLCGKVAVTLFFKQPIISKSSWLLVSSVFVFLFSEIL